MKKLWKQVKPLNLLALLAAGVVNAVGVTLFLAPVNLYDSGVSGTSMLLWQVTPAWMSLPLFLLILNLFLLIIDLGSKELMLQLLTIGGLLIALPLLAGIMTGLLEAAQEPIKEFIES